MKSFITDLLAFCLIVAAAFGVANAEARKTVEPPAAVAAEAEAAVHVTGDAAGPSEVRVDALSAKGTSETAVTAASTEEAAAAPEASADAAEPKAEEAAATPRTQEQAETAEPEAAEPEAAAETAEPETAEAETAEQTAENPEQAEAAPEESPSAEPEEPTVAAGRLNYEALYSLYAPEEKVLKVGGKEESWGDYFYILFTQCGQIEDYFNSMAAYYGMQFGWTDPIEETEDGSGETYAEAALESADNLMVQLGALEAFAEKNGVAVSEEMRSLIEAQKKQDIISALGAEGTEEAFMEYLKLIRLSPEMYDRIVTQNFLYQESFNRLYGEKAEKLPEETALKYLEDRNYITAAHILIMNSDEATGEKLDEAALAEKKAELEALVAEFRAIEDPQARKEAFLQKMTELSEDPGKAYYPEGYTYTPGTMVPEFEDAAAALEDYAVSDVVETAYGYHILMRLPLSADAVVELNSSTGEPRTARMLAANQEYGEKLQAVAAETELEWLPEHVRPDLLAYVAA